MTEPKIVQLLPADGWMTAFRDEDGKELILPLLAWALLDNGDVRPLDVDSDGAVDFATDTTNFIRVFRPGT